MMRKIKYALAFLWGTVFSSSIWCLALFDDVPPLHDKATTAGMLWVLAFILVALSVVAIGLAIVAFFVDHWSDD